MNAIDAGLREVDRLDVLVLVDNATDSLSTTPKHVIPEWAGLRQAGRLSELSGAAICCAHHGLSLLVRTQDDVPLELISLRYLQEQAKTRAR